MGICLNQAAEYAHHLCEDCGVTAVGSVTRGADGAITETLPDTWAHWYASVGGRWTCRALCRACYNKRLDREPPPDLSLPKEPACRRLT